jgi:hypothetical protein
MVEPNGSKDAANKLAVDLFLKQYDCRYGLLWRFIGSRQRQNIKFLMHLVFKAEPREDKTSASQ